MIPYTTHTHTHARTHARTHTHTHTLRLKVPPYMSCRYTYISSSQQEETITTPSPWFPGESVYKCMAHATQYDDVEDLEWYEWLKLTTLHISCDHITIRQVECISLHNLESLERRDHMCYHHICTVSTNGFYANMLTYTYAVKSFTIESSLVSNWALTLIHHSTWTDYMRTSPLFLSPQAWKALVPWKECTQFNIQHPLAD